LQRLTSSSNYRLAFSRTTRGSHRVASFFLTLLVSPFKSKSRLEAENAALRHQLIVLRRKVRGRVQLTNGDRLFLVLLYRWFPSVLKIMTIIRPETLEVIANQGISGEIAAVTINERVG
jgi:hypothetical protein